MLSPKAKTASPSLRWLVSGRARGGAETAALRAAAAAASARCALAAAAARAASAEADWPSLAFVALVAEGAFSAGEAAGWAAPEAASPADGSRPRAAEARAPDRSACASGAAVGPVPWKT